MRDGRLISIRGCSVAGRHQGATKEFRELSFAEQAKSITATINHLQAAIEHHIKHSPRRSETIEKCLSQIERLEQRLRVAYKEQGAEPGSGEARPASEEVPRVRVVSPRLAEPERAVDFTLEVVEEPRNAGLR